MKKPLLFTSSLNWNKHIYTRMLIVLFFSLFFSNVFAATKTFTGSGNFSDPLRWNGLILPAAGDNLIIDGICTIDNNAGTDNVVYGTLTIGGSIIGTVNWTASGTNRLNVTNVLSLRAGSSLNMTNGGTLIITGSFTSTNLAFTSGTGTIEIQSTITLPSAYTTYNNININGSGVTVSSGVGTTVNGNLTITSGTFSVGAFSLAVSNTLTVGGTFFITSSTGAKSFRNFIINNGSYTNSANAPVTISGNLQNNGVYNGGTGRVTFTGAASNTISGATTTAFNGGITVNKGISNANILDVQCMITMVAGGLILTNGTFKLSSASTITPFTADIVPSPYLIPTTAGLWCNGGTINSPAGGMTWSVQGLVRISDGTLNAGSVTGDWFAPRSGATIIIEGGNFNVADRISQFGESWSYSMTGGTLTVPTVGSNTSNRPPFNMEQAGCSFSMSGGTIIIERNGGSAGENSGYYNIATGGTGFTGGTLQMGDALTPASETMGITSTNPIFNLLVNSSNATAQLQTSSLTVSNNITISAGTLDANNLNIIVGNDWTSSGSFTEGTGTVTFTSTLIQTITRAAGETFYNLTVNTTGILKLANSVIVTNALAMTNGNINLNGNTLTLGSGAGATLTHPGTTTAYGGTFRRWWPVGAISSTAGSLYGLFPIGTAYDYRSVEVNSTVNPTTAGYVSAIHTDAVTITDVTYTDNEGDAIQRIQNMKSTLSTSGLAGGTYSIAIKYTCLSATGLLPRMKLETYTGSIMGSAGTGGVTTGPVTTPTVKRTGLTVGQLSNDFVIGTKDKVTTPLTQYYYSRKSGNWSDNSAAATWSYTIGGAGASCNCKPGNDGYAVISAGQTVSVDAVSTVNYIDISSTGTLNGTANLTVNFDLTVFGSGKFTPSAGAWTVTRDVYVTPTSNSSIPSGGMTINTDLILNGIIAVGANTLTLNGIGRTISGTGSITGAGTLSITTGNKTIPVGSTLTIAPTVAITGAIIVNNSGTVTLSGNLTGSVAGSTWSNNENSTLNVAGTVLATGTLNSIAANNTVNYNGSGAQTIKIPSSSMYYNLIGSNAGTKSIAGTTRVNNLLTLSNAAILDVATNNLSGTGGLTMNNTSRLILSDINAGNQPQPLFTGTYTLASGTTIEFAGAAAQNATVAPYQNVEITGNNSASSVSMSNVSTILGNLTFTNMGQMNSNVALTISGHLNYGSSQRTSIVNTVTVIGNSTFSAGIFDLNSENLTTNNLIISTGTLMTNGILNVKGNITNNQPTTTTTGTLNMNGTGVQTFGGTQPFKTYNLITNNSAGIILNTNLSVSGVHTFTAGIITTSATPNYLIYEAGSSYSGDADTRHVNGWVKKIGSTNFIFPVGNGTVKRVVAINSLSTSGEFNAKYLASTPNSYQYQAPIRDVNESEYWSIEKISGGTATVTMNWDNSKVFFPNWVVADILVASYNGSVWVDNGGTASGTAATTGTITSNPVSSFSLFALGSKTYVLSATLTNFTATRQDNHTLIGWTIAKEYNVDYYIAERSDNNLNFYSVAQLTARNSDGSEMYSVIDHAAINHIAWYRLKSTDKDGRVTFSRVVAITNETNRKELVLLTNPVYDQLILEANGQINSNFDYHISNMNGQTIQKGSLAIGTAGRYTIPLKGKLPAGIYILAVSNDSQSFTYKINVQ